MGLAENAARRRRHPVAAAPDVAMEFEARRGIFSADSLSANVSDKCCTDAAAQRRSRAGNGIDLATWSLRLENSNEAKPLMLSLDQIKTLPEVDTVTELKCIEGWSDPVYWTGVRLADLAARFGKATRSGKPADLEGSPSDLFRYVSLSTPDMGYYVGLDIESALHPQTLLCYAMNHQPLTLEHGAPLRLVIPVKYGIKYIKWIGTIRFTDERPADYWAERGYDWYAGH
jgi:DMSO/TMAO reductase YedYZ molybdopterin-dependent catalytic subunit